MIETIIGSFLIIILAAAAIAVGQFFGRPPVTGKCGPDNPRCCMNQNSKRADCRDGGN